MRTRVLVTGSAGFLGRALAARFSREASVLGTIRTPGADLPWRTLVHDWERGAIDRPAEIFIHAAFLAPPPEAHLRRNERMAVNVALSAGRSGASRVVLLSTGSVYAECEGFVSERSPRTDATAYARSARRIEQIFEAEVGKTLVIARLFFPYGPRQQEERLIARLAARIVRGQPVTLRGDSVPGGAPGRPKVNPVFVEDVGEAIVRLAQARETGVFNIGGPQAVTIRDLADAIAGVLGRPWRHEVDAAFPARDLCCSCERLLEVTGFAPMTDLVAGLKATLAHS